MNGEPYSRTHSDKTDRIGHERGSVTLAALGGVAVGVIIVLLAWLVVLMTRDDPVRQAADTPTSAPQASAPVSVTTRTVVPSVKAPRPRPRFRRLPATYDRCPLDCSVAT